jgi:hypothetical protein
MNPEDNKNCFLEKEKHELLLKLGFYTSSGKNYMHPMLKGLFDFSASSIEGIPVWIYNQAFIDGKSMKIIEIKRVLEIE